MTPEFSRLADVRAIDARALELVATPDECAALAGRFDLVAIERLAATVTLERDGAAVNAAGRLTAAIVQSCAISGEDLPAAIDVPLTFRFVPEAAPGRPGEEIELDADALDEIPFSGTQFDVGEAVAQSLALAIDPFATGPGAERVRESGLLGAPAESPFAVLKGLKPKA